MGDGSSDARVGAVLGDRYRIEGLIAVGGMGRVYRATQLPAGRACAVKILDDRAAAGLDDFHARFERETRVLATLTHPHIVEVFDSGVTPQGQPYLVMELVHGRTLREIIHQEGRLDVLRAVRLLHQAAEALRTAHARGIVHRDLKPSNLLVHEPDGPDGAEKLKVLDFGLTKLLSTDVEITRPGTVVGSPMYMAPEQVEGHAVSPATDVYGLGIALYNALAGSPPFESGSPTEIMGRHLREIPEPITRLRPEVPQAVERAIQRCLLKDPERRFNDAAELARALDACMVEMEGGAPVPEALLVEPPRSWRTPLQGQVRRWLRRPVAAPDPISIVLAVALFAVVVAMAGAWWADRHRGPVRVAPIVVPDPSDALDPPIVIEEPHVGLDLTAPPFSPPAGTVPPDPASPSSPPSVPEPVAPVEAPPTPSWPTPEVSPTDIRDPWQP